MAAVNSKTAPHRSLRFKCFDCVRAELDRIEGAERAGNLRTTGNWTPGQILGHLASWVGYAYDGPPPDWKPVPWFVKVMARLMKRSFVTRPMPKNFRVGGVEAGTYGTEVVPFDDGLRRFRAAIDRLEREAPTRPSPVFGPLTHEQWKNLHLRHAELHLGFLDYPGAGAA